MPRSAADPASDRPGPGDRPAPAPDDVAVLVVNWNSWHHSLACLAALRRTQGAAWHLYLVDNASTDGSLDRLQALGDDVTLIASPDNGGWTGGNNLAVERALADGFQRLFILNNDVQVLPNTLAVLLRTAAQLGPRAILGPVHLADDGVSPEFIGATIDPRTGLADITDITQARVDALPATYPTAFIKGAGIFTSRAQIERLGPFDDAYYLNYDDTEWAFQARAAGYDQVMVRDAQIIHGGSGSIGGGYSPLNVYFLARNQLLFAERHCRLAQRPRQLVEFVRNGNRLTPASTKGTRFLSLLFGRTRLARAWRAGVRDYLLRRFGDCPPAIRRLSAIGD